MKKSDNLFELEAPPKGWVSARCQISDDDANQRYVFLDDVPVYSYDLSDAAMQRFVWVNIYKRNYATYQQISGGTGIALRTLKYWVKNERELGAEGLITQKGGGRKSIPENKKNQILRLRKERLTYREIARLCGVANGTVWSVLKDASQVCSNHPQLQFPAQAEEAAAAVEDVDAQIYKNDGSEVKIVVPATAGNAGITFHEDELEAVMALDRSVDRQLARMGKLSDAEPLFAPGQALPFAGLFIAFVILASDPLLKVGLKVIPGFSAAFYGVRTTLMTLVCMFLLRLKRPEDLRRDNPVALGRILGLDRVQEVKTIRGKISQWGSPEMTEEFMRRMAYERSQEYNGNVSTVMIDGHITAYFGKRKVGATWSSRDNRVVNGQTENWVNLPGKCPLFSIETPFNDGLSKSLEQALVKTRQILGIDELTCVFDRGGYNIELFERLTESNYGIITYSKGNYGKIAENLFARIPTVIGDREYEHAPFEREIELKVYASIDRGPNRKPGRRDTKRTVKMREIRILRPDGGQTAILANRHVKMDCIELAAMLFSRIGSQENIFKYMRSEFDIDALAGYEFESVEPAIEHPNPDFSALEAEAAILREKRNALLAELGSEVQSVEPEQAPELLRRFGHTDKAVKLEEINNRLLSIKSGKSETPVRENAAAAGYKRPKPASKRLMNVIKMAAYMIETKLFEQLEPHYKNNSKEGRKLLAAAFKTSGSLKLAKGEIIITLAPQSSPARTKAINGLTAELNKVKAKFPGSSRIIRFEATEIIKK